MTMTGERLRESLQRLSERNYLDDRSRDALVLLAQLIEEAREDGAEEKFVEDLQHVHDTLTRNGDKR
jgi:hypothetical protein